VGRTLEQELANGWVQSVHPDDLDRCFASYIGSDIDITDVKRAEQELILNQALRRSEEKYHRIVETMTEGVWILDHNDRTTFVNQQMAAMLGYCVEQMVGRNVLDFKDEEGRPIALQRTGTPAPGDHRTTLFNSMSLGAGIGSLLVIRESIKFNA